MLSKFYDAKAGGFWQAPPGTSDLILRVKEDYDGAEPSGNLVAILALLKLGAVTETKSLTDAAEQSLRLFSDRLRQVPQAVPFMLAGLDFSLTPPQRVVIAGDPHSPAGRALLRAAHSVYHPHKVVLGTAGPVDPFARTLRPKHAQATAYVCVGTTCLPPVNEPERLAEHLAKK
jgi:hypothetical protein